MKLEKKADMQNKKLVLDPNWIAFRKIYKDLIKEKKITTVFRPAARLCGDFRGYCEGQIVTVGIIDKVGADWGALPPVFLDESFGKIKITSAEARQIKELTSDDFIGSSPDVQDTTTLKFHLGIIYNLSPEQVTDDSVVTRIQFEYLQY